MFLLNILSPALRYILFGRHVAICFAIVVRFKLQFRKEILHLRIVFYTVNMGTCFFRNEEYLRREMPQSHWQH